MPNNELTVIVELKHEVRQAIDEAIRDRITPVLEQNGKLTSRVAELETENELLRAKLAKHRSE